MDPNPNPNPPDAVQSLAEDEATAGCRTPDTRSRLTARSIQRTSGAVQEVLRPQHEGAAAVTL